MLPTAAQDPVQVATDWWPILLDGAAGALFGALVGGIVALLIARWSITSDRESRDLAARQAAAAQRLADSRSAAESISSALGQITRALSEAESAASDEARRQAHQNILDQLRQIVWVKSPDLDRPAVVADLFNGLSASMHHFFFTDQAPHPRGQRTGQLIKYLGEIDTRLFMYRMGRADELGDEIVPLPPFLPQPEASTEPTTSV